MPSPPVAEPVERGPGGHPRLRWLPRVLTRLPRVLTRLARGNSLRFTARPS